MKISKFFIIIAVIMTVFCENSFSQHKIKGSVKEITQKSKEISLEPLVNATIYWSGTTSGTTTNSEGIFEIAMPQQHSGKIALVASFVGFKNDTLFIEDENVEANFVLKSDNTLDEIVVQDRSGSYISQLNPIQTQIITQAGFQKLACCNLSESFENNAGVDVNYSDAVSGAKQIQMLGLAGIYTQILGENIPAIRGMASSYGLMFIPGTWMESIQISKGTSSVINGYESTTGQINVEYKKPHNAEKLHINLYGNDELKGEGNLIASYKLGEHSGTVLMLHASGSNNKFDHNQDGFIDVPTNKQFNAFNRWIFEKEGIYEIQAGFRFLKDNRNGGQMDYSEKNDSLYGLEINNQRYEGFAKIGIPFSREMTSLGFQISAVHHEQNSFFGRNTYDGKQNNAYLNAIFQISTFNPEHLVSVGGSLLLDEYNENFNDSSFSRVEKVPGVFGQYSFICPEEMSIIVGLRADFHSKFGTFLTPRFHFKYNLRENLIFRASAGKGYRSANVFPENIGILSTSREILFSESLKQEEAWNYGANLTFTQDFGNKRDLVWTIDFYRTDFQNQVVLNIETPTKAVFSNLNGKSYSNSFQTEVTVKPLRGLEMTAAFRYNDVKLTLNDILTTKPLVSRWKSLFTASYATRFEKWKFDITTQLNGPSRIPDTRSNPVAYQMETESPVYLILHAQITKKIKKVLDIYVGAENLTDYTQHHPILAAEAPFSKYFDSALIWGPIMGRTIYAGLRFTLK